MNYQPVGHHQNNQCGTQENDHLYLCKDSLPKFWNSVHNCCKKILFISVADLSVSQVGFVKVGKKEWEYMTSANSWLAACSSIFKR